MKIGDWVHFQTRNWPKESASVKAEHDSDKGLYTGMISAVESCEKTVVGSEEIAVAQRRPPLGYEEFSSRVGGVRPARNASMASCRK